MKLEQIKKAMEVVEKLWSLRESYGAAKTIKAKNEIAQEYNKINDNWRLSEEYKVLDVWKEHELERRKCGNEFMDLDMRCFVDSFVIAAKEMGVKKFAVSITSTSLMGVLAFLDREGYKPVGMTRVNKLYTNFDGRQMADAIVMEMK